MSATEAPSAARRRAGAVLTAAIGILLVASSASKVVGVPPVIQQLDALGLASKIWLIATLEVTGGTLLLVPRTRSLGLLFVSAFMGGAVATHIEHDQLGLPAALVLGLAWLGVWLRHPEALWSLRPRRDTARPAASRSASSVPPEALPST